MGEALGFETTSPNVIIGCWTASILLHFTPTIKSNSREGTSKAPGRHTKDTPSEFSIIQC